MLVAVLALSAVAVLAGLSAAAAMLASPRRLAVRRRVIVNMADGSAFSGVLWRRAGRSLVMRGARLHRDSRDTDGTPVDGEVLLDRAEVTFIQVLPAAA